MNPMTCVIHHMEIGRRKMLQNSVFVRFLNVATFATSYKVDLPQKNLLKNQFANDFIVVIFDGF
jgi:hypothetical protein